MPTSDQKIRWGVLGWARIARNEVIPAIRRSSRGVLHGIASRDAAKRADAAAQTGARTYASYDELLADPKIDAVYNPLPNALHKEWTIKAAAAGKHVLCEKPFTVNAAETREVIAAAGRHGVVVMEAFMYRYSSRIGKVREILRSGVLGEIKFVHSAFRFLLNRPGDVRIKPDLGGGSLYDVGAYPVNFVGMVVDEATGSAAGAGPVPVAVSAHAVREHGVDVQFSGLLQYPGGLIAAVHSGFNAHFRAYSEITGVNGSLEIPRTFFADAGKLTLVLGEDRREIETAEEERYVPEVDDLAGAILDGRPPQLPLAETLRNMEIIDRLYAAARSP